MHFPLKPLLRLAHPREVIFSMLVSTMLCLTLVSNVYSQKIIKLTKGSRSITIPVGKRVKYELASGIVEAGRIQSIGDSSIMVNDHSVNIGDIKRFGRKNPGSNFRGIFFTSFGAVFALSVIKNTSTDTPPCSGCQPPNGTTTTSSDGSAGPGIIVGLGMTTWGVVILSRNSTKDVSHEWTLKVVDK